MPNSVPLPSCPSKACRLRADQRSDSSMDSRALRWSAGYGVHSSNTIATSESSARCTSIERSGDRNTSAPSTGERNLTPSSVSLRISARL
jgi:hypothetical protein